MAAIVRWLSNVRIWPGPILAVDLVATARRKRFFILRAFYAAASPCALFHIPGHRRLGRWRSERGGRVHLDLLGDLRRHATLGRSHDRPRLAAGAIAQERQRRTMEYLFTTPLSSLEIVVGKLGGRVLEVLGLVLAGLPVMALAMLLGGIAPQSLVALTAITLSTVVFVTEISLAISAWTAKARDAVIRAYLVFFGLWVLPLPLTAAPWMQQVAVLNPVLTFVESHFGWALGKSAEPWEVVLMLVRNQMLAGGMVLAVATLFMRRIHLREAARAVTRRSRLVRRRRREIGDNPMYWKEIYIEGGSSRLGLLGCGILVLVFIVICGLTSYMLFASLQSPTAPERGTVSTYALGVSTFLCCCGLLTVITRASGSITGERERDCWDVLIGTPLEPGEIIKGKVLGSIWPLRMLAPLLAVVWLPALLLQPSFLLGVVFFLLGMAIVTTFAAARGVFCSHAPKPRSGPRSLRCRCRCPRRWRQLCCCPVNIVAAPFCVPFLLAGPGMAILMLDSTGIRWDPFAILAVGAYLVGLVSYTIAAWLLMRSAIRNFDKKSGRTQRPPVVGGKVATPIRPVANRSSI